MAGYLLPRLSKSPRGLKCAETADGVYKLFGNPEAIHDLNLPNPIHYPWAPASPVVRVIFRIVPDEVQDPPSYTQIIYKSCEIECLVCYSAEELLRCPHIVHNRLTHELTNGIRLALIKSTATMHRIQEQAFEFCPSRKYSIERLRQDRFLFMMHPSAGTFLPGHWVQHHVFGGIIVGLDDSYITDMSDPANSTVKLERRAYFKIICTALYETKRRKVYYKLEGYLYNSDTRAFGPKTAIFHSRLIGW